MRVATVTPRAECFPAVQNPLLESWLPENVARLQLGVCNKAGNWRVFPVLKNAFANQGCIYGFSTRLPFPHTGFTHSTCWHHCTMIARPKNVVLHALTSGNRRSTPTGSEVA
jgi:hypothetical protein